MMNKIWIFGEGLFNIMTHVNSGPWGTVDCPGCQDYDRSLKAFMKEWDEEQAVRSKNGDPGAFDKNDLRNQQRIQRYGHMFWAWREHKRDRK